MKSDICHRQYQDKLETGIVVEYYKNEMKKKRENSPYNSLFHFIKDGFLFCQGRCNDNKVNIKL